jgi:hypothetical protein
MSHAIRLTEGRTDERILDRMFSYVSLEQRVPEDHPLRAVCELTDGVRRLCARSLMRCRQTRGVH